MAFPEPIGGVAGVERSRATRRAGAASHFLRSSVERSARHHERLLLHVEQGSGLGRGFERGVETS
jgi:hypothetical protein